MTRRLMRLKFIAIIYITYIFVHSEYVLISWPKTLSTKGIKQIQHFVDQKTTC